MKHAMQALKMLAIVVGFSTIAVAGIGNSIAQTPRAVQTIPAVPQTGSVFMVQMIGYNCEVFWGVTPWSRDVVVNGQSVTVTIQYTPAFSGGGCDYTSPIVHAWYLGPLAPGQYTLTLIGVDPLSGDETLSIAIPLQIAQSFAPLVVPAQSPLHMGLLILLVSIVSFVTLKRR